MWWVLTEYSTSLKKATPKLTTRSYALVAAAEAGDRTHVLPPPRSARALVARALKSCKASPKKNLTLVDFLGAADSVWRAELLKNLVFADCLQLLPVVAGLAKCQEFDDSAAAMKVLPKLCPGLIVDVPLLLEDVAYQFYGELMFLKALEIFEG